MKRWLVLALCVAAAIACPEWDGSEALDRPTIVFEAFKSDKSAWDSFAASVVRAFKENPNSYVDCRFLIVSARGSPRGLVLHRPRRKPTRLVGGWGELHTGGVYRYSPTFDRSSAEENVYVELSRYLIDRHVYWDVHDGPKFKSCLDAERSKGDLHRFHHSVVVVFDSKKLLNEYYDDLHDARLELEHRTDVLFCEVDSDSDSGFFRGLEVPKTDVLISNAIIDNVQEFVVSRFSDWSQSLARVVKRKAVRASAIKLYSIRSLELLEEAELPLILALADSSADASDAVFERFKAEVNLVTRNKLTKEIASNFAFGYGDSKPFVSVFKLYSTRARNDLGVYLLYDPKTGRLFRTELDPSAPKSTVDKLVDGFVRNSEKIKFDEDLPFKCEVPLKPGVYESLTDLTLYLRSNKEFRAKMPYKSGIPPSVRLNSHVVTVFHTSGWYLNQTSECFDSFSIAPMVRKVVEILTELEAYERHVVFEFVDAVTVSRSVSLPPIPAISLSSRKKKPMWFAGQFNVKSLMVWLSSQVPKLPDFANDPHAHLTLKERRAIDEEL